MAAGPQGRFHDFVVGGASARDRLGRREQDIVRVVEPQVEPRIERQRVKTGRDQHDGIIVDMFVVHRGVAQGMLVVERSHFLCLLAGQRRDEHGVVIDENLRPVFTDDDIFRFQIAVGPFLCEETEGQPVESPGQCLQPVAVLPQGGRADHPVEALALHPFGDRYVVIAAPFAVVVDEQFVAQPARTSGQKRRRVRSEVVVDLFREAPLLDVAFEGQRAVRSFEPEYGRIVACADTDFAEHVAFRLVSPQRAEQSEGLGDAFDVLTDGGEPHGNVYLYLFITSF